MKKYSMDLVETLREMLISKAFSILSESHLQEIASVNDPHKQLSLLYSEATPAFMALRKDVFITTHTPKKRKTKVSRGMRILRNLGIGKKKKDQTSEPPVAETIDSLSVMKEWEVCAFFDELNKRCAEISEA